MFVQKIIISIILTFMCSAVGIASFVAYVSVFPTFNGIGEQFLGAMVPAVVALVSAIVLVIGLMREWCDRSE